MVDQVPHFNVLFSSLSAKIALYDSVKNEIATISSGINLLGADSDKSCVGSKKVQDFTTIPPIHELKKESLLHYCRENKVQFIVPTRDG